MEDISTLLTIGISLLMLVLVLLTAMLGLFGWMFVHFNRKFERLEDSHRKDMGDIRTEINGIRTELNDIRTELNDIRTENNNISSDVKILTVKVDSLVETVIWMRNVLFQLGVDASKAPYPIMPEKLDYNESLADGVREPRVDKEADNTADKASDNKES